MNLKADISVGQMFEEIPSGVGLAVFLRMLVRFYHNMLNSGGFEVEKQAQGKGWHALFVVTGDEDNVKQRLEYRLSDRLRILVPKRRLKERKGGIWTYTTRALFPGYVLFNGAMDVNTYYDLKNVPGLYRLLRCGEGYPSIDDREMHIISRLTCHNEIIDFSDVLIANGSIKVVDGPLVSLEGIILSINHRKGRARVKLNFLGEEKIVELGVSVLRPA